MISKAKVKYIRSLELKKHRNQERVFVVEGIKAVEDLLAIMPAKMLIHTSAWHATRPMPETEIIEVSDDEMRKVSFLQHPQGVMAVFPQQSVKADDWLSLPQSQLILALDGIQDPGNMGTIIRTADWFGIRHIVCSEDTVDVYNPKVVQATMGSIARVGITYTRLDDWLSALDAEVPVYGTLLDGTDIYATPLTENGVIIMGNEGKGISEALRQRISHKLLIPNYPADSETAESLNVAVATAITCSEFRRRMLKR